MTQGCRETPRNGSVRRRTRLCLPSSKCLLSWSRTCRGGSVDLKHPALCLETIPKIRWAAIQSLRVGCRVERSGTIAAARSRSRVLERSVPFRTYRATEVALYHSLGKLPEPDAPSAQRFC